MSRNPNAATRTGTPFIRVRLGSDDIFVSGDGLLKECEVTLAEGQGLSNCSFSIYDRNLTYTRKYFDYVEKNEGLDPLFIPDRTTNRRNQRRRNGRAGALDSETDANKIQYMYDYYIDEGFSEYAAAAMVGNAMQESSLNPHAVGTDQGAEGTPGASEGLFQWTFERKDGLPSDFEGQVAFAIDEMQNDSPGSYEVLTNPNASEAEVREAIEDWIRWGTTGSRWDFTEEVLQQVNGNTRRDTQSSVSNARNPERRQRSTVVRARTGQQITIELGFDGETIVAYSFLHQTLEFDLFAPRSLVFGGQAAAWVLAQRKRNTAYTNMSLKQIAQKICEGYGLNLEMSEDGPAYDYFPQRGQSDYESLLIECRRIGYRIQCIGNTLKIGSREANDSEFILEYGVNLGTTFTVKHSAQSDSSGGARASDPNDRATTGERKFYIDPDTGEALQVVQENDAGTGNTETTIATTGNHITSITPITRGDTDEVDTARRESEKRIKGIIANWSAPTLPEMLLLDPDTALRTRNITPAIASEVVNTLNQIEAGLDTPLIEQGIATTRSGGEQQGSETASPLDRIWVIESITHAYSLSSGFNTSGVMYSPMRNRFPSSDGSSGGTRAVNLPDGCQGKLAQAALAYVGADTSAGPGGGRVACVYAVNRIFEDAGLDTPWGTSEFVPTAEEALISSGATEVSPGDEQPGDIVIAGNQYHIGIVSGSGQVISNSSSAAAFVWESNLDFDGYYSSSSRIYRLNC